MKNALNNGQFFRFRKFREIMFTNHIAGVLTCPTLHHPPVVHDQELPSLQIDRTLEFLLVRELVEFVVGCIPLWVFVEGESRGGPVDLVVLNPDEISIRVRADDGGGLHEVP